MVLVIRNHPKRGGSLVNLRVIANSFFHDEALKHVEEPLVIGGVFVPRIRRSNLDDQMFTEFVPIVKPSLAEPNCHGEGATFPWFIEDRFPITSRDGRRTVRVGGNALGQIGHGSYPLGKLAFATPIIESRVTSAASSASLIASVPGGRSGRTR